jgi:hypothetical protein
MTSTFDILSEAPFHTSDFGEGLFSKRAILPQ